MLSYMLESEFVLAVVGMIQMCAWFDLQGSVIPHGPQAGGALPLL